MKQGGDGVRRGFFNGLLVGGILGTLVGLFTSPQMKPTPEKYLMGRTKKIGRRAGKIISEMTHDFRHIMKK